MWVVLCCVVLCCVLLCCASPLYLDFLISSFCLEYGVG